MAFSERNFLAALSDWGDEISNLDNILLEVSGRIVADLKAAAPVSQGGGDLRNSIQALIQDNTLTIQMLAYGAFVNYGVKGTEDNAGLPVPFGAGPEPTAGYGASYAYETRRFGIDGSTHQWYDYEQVATRIQNEIANRLEL